jgi:fermentation-respiration switch protein FrsA (DUF1100 family)
MTGSNHSRHRIRSPVLRYATTVLVVFATIAVLTMLLERSLIYFPTRYPDGFWDAEAVARGSGCVIEDCYFEADDGIKLHGWWCRKAGSTNDNPSESNTVLLWFHGNAGNLSHRAQGLLQFAQLLPAEVLIFDYRGYGRSEGKPSEKGLYRDARAAWRFLQVERSIAPERIVLFGRSLGAGVAVDLATHVAPAGLVVESGFSSIPAMARHHYPFIPRFLVRSRMDSLTKIRTISCPKLFVHSRADEVAPFELGYALFEAAPEPKMFYEVEGAGHNETSLVGGRAYFATLAEFINSTRR